jgi:signal transduction histidine kinase/HAMP domain-containing protein
MLGLRQKISLGFAGLLMIVLVIGIQSILSLTRLGESIDVILRENYRSVIACQQMKEALERIDSGLLFILLGDTEEGEELVLKNEGVFEKALQIELNNITVPGEGEKAAQIRALYGRYITALNSVKDTSEPAGRRREAYFSGLLPLFGQIKSTADEILQMNQQNMNDANNQARYRASHARRQMYVLVIIGTFIAVAFIFFAGRWILRPIQRLIQSAEEIRRGNLDLVVQSRSRDEIGYLSESFNAMAASLREFRRTDQAKLLRIQRATQQAFDSLTDAVAVLDLEGRVEVATETAKNIFGLRPGTTIFDLPFGWMADLYNRALKEGRRVSPKDPQKLIQQFLHGEERYYRPEAVPILDSERLPAGVILVLQDVTQLQQQDEIKRDVIRTVSHQLKTPLTSIRMAIHLLLEEKVGSLTEKQVDLLLAAREDSDRLYEILANLLDISRIVSGKVQMELRTISPQTLVMDAIEPYRRSAQDQGVALNVELRGDLPDVRVDTTRVNHVFGNLLSNALKYTPPGGTISIAARAEEDWVRFSISDTGVGIPSQYLPRIFEPFFRVPSQGQDAGAGLGLAIAKEIVEAHGGKISVESLEGKGTTFIFMLKRADRTSDQEYPR